MAFGINRQELKDWKTKVLTGNIAILTHYWLDDRFPSCHTVTKIGCSDIEKLINWGKQYGLQSDWIHQHAKYPHFDLFGHKQIEVLKMENHLDIIERFTLKKDV